MSDDHPTTTIYKVIGGLSTTRLRPDFVVTFKFCATNKRVPVDSSTLTFMEKINDGQTIT